jgi:pimeloyl-ACP methyl ester carboxylesterase
LTSFVLVHGAWHGGWAWSRLLPLLAARGHAAVAPDLPGRGADPTPAADITLQRYIDAIASLVAAQDGPVVLVGHSLAGLTISGVAEALPERLAAAVYLAAFLLRDGQSVLDYRRARPPSGPTALPGTRIASPDGHSDTLSPAAALAGLFNTTDPAVARDAASRLIAEPVATRAAPMRLSQGRFGRVPLHYIETLQDRIIPIEDQRDMQRNWKLAGVHAMDTDHSPFLCAPEALAAVLDGIAQGVQPRL